MSNTQNHTALSVVNASLVLAGMILLTEGARGFLQADALMPQSGVGAFITQGQYVAGETMLIQGVLRSAAPSAAHMGPELALGMLLILLGCTVHALLVVQNQKPIGGPNMKQKVDSRDLGGIRRYMEVFWIDMRK